MKEATSVLLGVKGLTSPHVVCLLVFAAGVIHPPVLLHNFLLKFFLLSLQVVEFIGQSLLLLVVGVLVLHGVGEQFVVLPQQLRHLAHERPPVLLQAAVGIIQHLALIGKLCHLGKVKKKE